MSKKTKIEVNSVRELNDNQLEIIITGINVIRNSEIMEVIEETFKNIKKGNCKKCPINPPIDECCICVFQDGND